MFPPEDQVVEFFLEAYRHGAFPMAEPARAGGAGSRARANRIDWFIPDPRAVIELHAPSDLSGRSRSAHDLGGFHIPRSLLKTLRFRPFDVTTDRAFERVIRSCAEPVPGREETWLDERLIRAYIALHEHGHAHSIEAWTRPAAAGEAPQLAGGVYGVAIGSTFSAESMFCRPDRGGTNASKVALAHLVRHLRVCGFTLLDVQLRNHHTDQFGVVEISGSDYQTRLRAGLACRRTWRELSGQPW